MTQDDYDQDQTQDQHEEERAQTVVTQLVRSMTGFEDLAVASAFGKQFDQMSGTFCIRALVFVTKRREGLKDRDAYRMVMSMTGQDIDDWIKKIYESPDAEGN